MSAINRQFFFDTVRITLFGGNLKQSQVAGMTGFLDLWEASFSANDDRWLAYILGTAHHEVDMRMQPIHEYGGNTYFHKQYDINGDRPHVARTLGNLTPGDGVAFHGRGFVQLTGRSNYQDWKNRLGVDLIGSPDLALRLDIAIQIIFNGMILGTFTHKKLGDYFNPTMDDWVNARRTVNGTDKANLIAGYGKKYYAAIAFTV